MADRWCRYVPGSIIVGSMARNWRQSCHLLTAVCHSRSILGDVVTEPRARVKPSPSAGTPEDSRRPWPGDARRGPPSCVRSRLQRSIAMPGADTQEEVRGAKRLGGGPRCFHRKGARACTRRSCRASWCRCRPEQDQASRPRTGALAFHPGERRLQPDPPAQAAGGGAITAPGHTPTTPRGPKPCLRRHKAPLPSGSQQPIVDIIQFFRSGNGLAAGRREAVTPRW
jgi:hypothetical protein